MPESRPGSPGSAYVETPADRIVRERLSLVLSLLCDGSPPSDLVRAWLAHDESWIDDPSHIGPPMQEWVNAHCRLPWIMSLDLLDAAEDIARAIRDGEDQFGNCIPPSP